MNAAKNRRSVAIGLGLAAVTVCLYWPMTYYGFVSYDDPYHILYNRFVSSGLSWRGISWAMRSGYASNWQPLTWISHMLDCSLYGLQPGGHHLTNLLLHVVNTLLLFFVLRRMTNPAGGEISNLKSQISNCFFVAALFAWHPLHVESVAWISERKDVLSGFFFLLTLWAYVRYAEQVSSSRSGRETPNSKLRILCYCGALIFFAFGLMSKAMLVTTPFVLLLLDFWPLRRFRSTNPSKDVARPDPKLLTTDYGLWTIQRLLFEKVPFLLLSSASSVITFLAQKNTDAVAPLTSLPFGMRLANAAVSYLRYLEKTLWPANLTICYPYPDHWPTSVVATAVIVIAAGSVFACWRMRQQPYLFTGWFWFLGMLVPVIGLVQVGTQSMADRYTYLPSIGLFLLLVWGTRDVISALLQATADRPSNFGVRPYGHERFAAALGAFALVACLVCSARQLRHWRDGEALFRHALAVTSGNGPAYDGLGVALSDAGRNNEALDAFRESVRLQPESANAQFNLGNALLETGHPEESLCHFEASLRIWPSNSRAHLSYGCTLFRLGRLDDARVHFAKAAELEPENPQAHYDLATVLLTQTNLAGAVVELGSAVRLDPGYAAEAVKLAPNDPLLRYNLGTVLLMQSQIDDAVTQLAEAVRLDPRSCEAHRNFAVALMRQGKPESGISQFVEAARLHPDDPSIHFDLAQALLSRNRPEEAATQLNLVLHLKPNDPNANYQLSAAYAGLGHFSDAFAAAQKAHDMALAANLPALAAQAEGAMMRCRRAQPAN